MVGIKSIANVNFDILVNDFIGIKLLIIKKDSLTWKILNVFLISV